MKTPEYIIFRLYDWFLRDDKDFAIVSLATFLYAVEISLIFFILSFGDLFVEADSIRNIIKECSNGTLIVIAIIFFPTKLHTFKMEV